MNDKQTLPTVIALLGIIFSFVWYQFIYEPMQREILSMELETLRLHEIERELAQLKARHENLSAFIEEKELQLDEAQSFLPSTLKQDDFIDQLYRTADFQALRIISIRAGDVTLSENFQSQVMSIRLQADYISLLNFIREVQGGGRLANLESFSLESSKGTIFCDLDFKIFAAKL